MLKKQAKQCGKSTQRPKRHASYYKSFSRLRAYLNKVRFFDTFIDESIVFLIKTSSSIKAK